tara:strand:- start:9092 stop:9946 length:855 start_codon:yes stop_codon:yes gene_type:complete
MKYLIQSIIIIFLLLIFKLIGLKYSRIIAGYILRVLGPIFRSKKIAIQNLSKAYPKLSLIEKKTIIKNMWFNYGLILAEYVFIKNFRLSEKFYKNIIIENQNELNEIKNNSKPVIFVSGHFNNFELMAMHIEKSGIDLAAIYRPLNNIFLNPIMEFIRKKYICKKQIKKGSPGTKEILKNFKRGTSIALMIDQRVSQGIASEFFNEKASTTTLPAQFVKKFGAKIIPIYIERIGLDKFKLRIFKSLKFSENESVENITLSLNKVLEEMIKKNPEQWIWTHSRWK